MTPGRVQGNLRGGETPTAPTQHPAGSPQDDRGKIVRTSTLIAAGVAAVVLAGTAAASASTTGPAAPAIPVLCARYDTVGLLTRAARITKLRRCFAGELRFRRLTVREVVRMNSHGEVFH